MKVKYVKEDQFYLLSNFSVSSNPIFLEKKDVEDFKNRLIKTLPEICEIYQCLFQNNQFQILVKLKSRSDFIIYYRKKKKNKTLPAEDIPESTYIISQELANIQSGYAKRFNYKYNRYGALFARRYTKIRLRTKKEILECLARLIKGVKYWVREKFWSYRFRFLEVSKGLDIINEKMYGQSLNLYDLQGRIKTPP